LRSRSRNEHNNDTAQLTRSSTIVGEANHESNPMHIPGSWLLLIFIAIATAAILLVLHLTRLGRLVHQEIPDRPHRRLFLASVSFFLTFLMVRLLVASITHHIGPFGYVEMGGRHIHHLVWGILLLLITGYATLAQVGESNSPASILLSRLLALGYGIGAALTLDEFALWLNLDAAAYWSRQGRESIDAVVLFGALLAIGTWGAPLFRRLAKNKTE
jgi:hypothetical protein